MKFNFFNFDTFDPEEYEHYEVRNKIFLLETPTNNIDCPCKKDKLVLINLLVEP